MKNKRSDIIKHLMKEEHRISKLRENKSKPRIERAQKKNKKIELSNAINETSVDIKKLESECLQLVEKAQEECETHEEIHALFVDLKQRKKRCILASENIKNKRIKLKNESKLLEEKVELYLYDLGVLKNECEEIETENLYIENELNEKKDLIEKLKLEANEFEEKINVLMRRKKEMLEIKVSQSDLARKQENLISSKYKSIKLLKNEIAVLKRKYKDAENLICLAINTNDQIKNEEERYKILIGKIKKKISYMTDQLLVIPIKKNENMQKVEELKALEKQLNTLLPQEFFSQGVEQ